MKELLEGFLSRLETETTPKEGEYLGDDGLLYCGKCHTPVQCRKELFGKMRILPCTCRCRQEEMRRQKEADEARERMNTIHRLKATGIQERHLLDWRFDVAEETDTIRWAKHYVETLAFCFGEMSGPASPSRQPALPMRCWNRQSRC